MRAVLDTHVLLWALTAPERLAVGLDDLLAKRFDQLSFSAVSIWEVAIKFALGRPDSGLSPEHLLGYAREAGFLELPVTSEVASRVASLPLHHRDPFDRLLIAQAMDEDAVLLTADAALAAYGPHVLMLGAVPSREA